MAKWVGEVMKSGRIISDISKRVLIVEGKSELDRILHLEENGGDHIINVKKLDKDVYEIELIKKVGSFYRVGD